MSNFKSGSGNLDFGGGDDEEDEDEDEEISAEPADSEAEGSSDSPPADTSTAGSEDVSSSGGSNSPQQSAHTETAPTTSVGSGPSTNEYPYFVRRNNVGDERDTRLEIHVRDKVANQEAAFRNELAEHLGTNEIAKTDAREFALLAAFAYPERVAELMREEGFGAFD